jgi:nicotinamidase-related amidase
MWSAAERTTGGTELPVKATTAEMLIGKQRRSAFASTRLALLLRTNEVRSITVAGADVAPGSMTATVLDGLDADYAVTIAADACADLDTDILAQAGARLAQSADIKSRWRARAAVSAPSEALSVAT